MDTLSWATERAERSEPAVASSPSTASTTVRKIRPVKWWAGIGLTMLGLEIYVMADWVASGRAHRTPAGPTRAPGWMPVVGTSLTILGFVILAFVLYRVVYRPWRREQQLTLDGMLTIAFLLLFWQDPWLNYSQTISTYNSAAFFNLGNWASSLPGWLSPRGSRMAEPILWIPATYCYAILGFVLVANLIMRRAKARWPQLGTAGMIGVALACGIGFDFVFESIWLRVGVYTYAGSINWLTLFSGHTYQFPVYDAVFAGSIFAGLACVRYFVDDHGRTLAERGIDQMKAPRGRKTGIRFLAIVGIVNVVMIVTYNLPMQWFALHTSPWPTSITSRSYLTDGICGTGTVYACPGPLIPIPTTGSSHVAPDGTLKSSK
jgi:Spirocyclase AveC-like